MEDERWLMMGVLDHLQKASRNEGMNQDAIMEAIFAVSNAYSLNMHNAATKERYSLGGHSMVDIFKAGLKQLSGDGKALNNGVSDAPRPSSDTMDVDASSPTASASAAASASASASESDPGFTKFLAILREKTAFFKGVNEGSRDYQDRIKRAREKYDAKLESKKQKTPKVSERSAGASTEAKAKAEALKAEGNVKLKAKDYSGALDLYTKAIELDGNNAVYYSNRAAADLLLRRYTEAVEDCKRAINIDKKFLRPRERLAAAYRHLGMTKNEVDALKDALKLAPDNENMKKHLRDAEARLSGGSSTSGTPSGLGAMLGNMPADPNALNEMARSMGINLPEGAIDSFMSSGGMQQMESMIRENPNIMQQAMQAMMSGGGFPGMGDGQPNGGEGQG